MRAGVPDKLHQDYTASLFASELPMTKLDATDTASGSLIPGAFFVRALGLDEIPQLINVLRGDMSLVGPRPCTVAEFDRHPALAGRRTAVLPGITGWWQVNGKNHTSFRKMIELDSFYADHASWHLDFRILLMTPAALVNQIQSATCPDGVFQSHAS